MSSAQARTREDVLAPIAEAFEEAVPDGGGADFVRRYFRYVPLDELTSRTPDIYAGAAASHLALARDRHPGVANVRVYNPTTEVDGWSNARTVIQIVTDDMPFLVDSVTGALVGAGIDIHLIVHPQLIVSRDAVGHLEAVLDRDATGKVAKGAVGEVAESWMLLAVDRESDEARRNELERTVRHVLEDVRQAVEDWPKMRTKALVVAAELEGAPPEGIDADETALAIRFLRWMADNHFTFLGYRDYTLRQTEAGEVIEPVTGSGLGLLRSDPPLGKAPEVLSAEASAKAHEANILVLTKANSRSTVHRVAHLDYVGVKAYADDGTVVGERRFLGLYASTAYTESVLRVPLVAEKVQGVLDRSGVAHDSHTGKDLLGVLESYPRDELIQASVEQLYETTMAVTQLQERRRTKLFIREDDFGRFVSCLVYIPRDRYNTAVRMRMAEILKETFGGDSVEFTARVSESALSRLQFVVRMPKGERIRQLTDQERADLEQRLVEVSRTWTDRLGDALREHRGEVEGNRLFDRFGRGFPTSYEETFTTSQGLADLSHLDRLSEDKGTSVALYKPAKGTPEVRRFKLFRADPALAHRHPADLHAHGRRGRRRAALRSGASRRHPIGGLRLRLAREGRRHLGVPPA
jgi:glutamate dehydrogenase